VTTLPDGQLFPSKTYAGAEVTQPEEITIASKITSLELMKAGGKDRRFIKTVKARFMRI